MQVEIINPMGTVSYRRPHRDPLVKEALNTIGYSVLFPGCTDLQLLAEVGCQDYPVSIGSDGMLVSAVVYGKTQ